MMDLARFLMDNELGAVPLADARGLLSAYLAERNLPVDLNALFEKLLNRCEFVVVDPELRTLSLKHRSFAEYFYARAMLRDGAVTIDSRAFNFYWLNVFFFLVGIQRDAPRLIEQLVQVVPETEGGRWLKVAHMGNFLLAGYRTRYGVIEAALCQVALEAGRLYRQIVNREVDSVFSALPRIHVLYFFQYLMRKGYSYSFLVKAIESAAMAIVDSAEPREVRAYATFFLSMAYNDADGGDGFQLFLEHYSSELPLDLMLAVHYETDNAASKTALMRKQDRHFRKILQGNRNLSAAVERLHRRPVRVEGTQDREDLDEA